MIADADDAALAQLVREHHDRIYRFGVHVCRDGYDADDAVQEAFTKLARRPDVVRDRGVLSWLMTVVRHACLHLMRPFIRERRRLGERIADADTIAAPTSDPHEALERWELVQRVHAAIAALPQPLREVLVMRDIEGISGPDTCEALGLGLAAMKTRLHRARAELRAALATS